MMRALGGVAARGPELGTDPFGSFQAGIRGAIATGQQQQLADAQGQMAQIQQLRAYADLMRATQEKQDPFTRKLEAVRQMLGRDLTPDEEQRLAGIDPDQTAMTPEQKLEHIRTAYGGKLNDQQTQKALGIYVDPTENNPQRLRGPAGEIYDWASGMGFPLGNDMLHPNPDVFSLASRGYQNRQARTKASLTYDPMFHKWQPSFSEGGMTPDMAQYFQPKPGETDPTQAWFRGFGALPELQRREEEGVRLLNRAFSAGDLQTLRAATADPQSPYLASLARTYLGMMGHH